MEKKALETIRKYRMVTEGEKIIVAVSGGPDSVCLLNVLYRLKEILKITIVVAHLNHGLRPKEDGIETEFVSKIAEGLNCPFFIDKAHNLAGSTGASIEERAREARYEFLERVLREYDGQKVALGHNMNDQAETMLINLLRGAGPKGLSGIAPVRDNRFIRPLIYITGQEIHNYLEEKGIFFVTDSSNLDRRYLRNRIRLDLLPQLLRYQPRLFQHLSESASLLRQQSKFIEEEAQRCLHQATLDAGDHFLEISFSALDDLDSCIKNEIIRQAIKKLKGNLRRINNQHIKSILDLARKKRPQMQIHLPEALVAKKRYDRLVFTMKPIEAKDFSYYINGPGCIVIPEIGNTLNLEEIPNRIASFSSIPPEHAYLDLEDIHWPLRIRNFRHGDRYMPLGLGGFKKVKNAFIDKKIPLEERKRIPVLAHDDHIIWVWGIGIDERCKIKPDTKRILRCKIE